MMAMADAAAAVRDLRSRLAALATAFVARNGTVLGADIASADGAETVGILAATVLGAATTALRELGRSEAHRIVVEGTDSVTLIVPVGSDGLVVAVFDRTVDLVRAGELVAKFASYAMSSERPVPTCP